MTEFDETHGVPPETEEGGGKPLAFIKNDAGGDLQGYWEDVFPTMRSESTPAVARRECFGITPCDANGTRTDRPDGGLYVTKTDTSKTLTHGTPNIETVVVEPSGCHMQPDMETQMGADLYNGRQTGDVAATVAANSCATAARNGPSVLNVDAVVDMMGGKTGCHVSNEDVSPTLATTHNESHAIDYGEDECVPIDMRNATRDADKQDGTNRQGAGIGADGAPAPTVTASPPGVAWRATVRRLLPVETERLMGFPDNWTRIPWKGKPAGECPDAPRYKACGNSMAVNVMRWIGIRIDAEERRIQDERGGEHEGGRP
jgi:hypothetical protein